MTCSLLCKAKISWFVWPCLFVLRAEVQVSDGNVVLAKKLFASNPSWLPHWQTVVGRGGGLRHRSLLTIPVFSRVEETWKATLQQGSRFIPVGTMQTLLDRWMRRMMNELRTTAETCTDPFPARAAGETRSMPKSDALWMSRCLILRGRRWQR